MSFAETRAIEYSRVSRGLALAKADRPIICRITWKPAMRGEHDSGALRCQHTFKSGGHRLLMVFFELIRGDRSFA